ncbi:MAG: Nramp family divalent metal transporter [Alphaproteobacteria bacterium]|jgi:manganese transport protein|nr:Nramp family divalent metal transporter [Alphaproteobacteria bacterium]
MSKKARKFTFFKYMGPGVLVAVGFIDPGNWASNLAAGSMFGYSLLWVVSISTLMLILLQHNVAHLGIATGHCLAENTFLHIKPKYAQPLLLTALLAAISTSLAEILGGAIALNMLLGIPITLGVLVMLITVCLVTFMTNYQRLEKFIISFVAIIGFCFFYEVMLINVDWAEAAKSAVVISIPQGSMLIIVSILGAVVMPHNLFLHSEIIQTKNWFNRSPQLKNKLLKYEFLDTLFSMIMGWAINCVIIILAAEVFFKNNVQVEDLSQAADLLKPVLGSKAALVFAASLLCASFASSITAGIAGGIIFSAVFKKEYDEKSRYTRIGIILTHVITCGIILFIDDTLMGLLYSQMFLSMQLPFTIGLQIYLTSSKKVMGDSVNTLSTNLMLLACGIFVSVLNIILLYTMFRDW